MEIASKGFGEEAYTLRYAIDLAESFQFMQGKAPVMAVHDGISSVIEPVPSGLLVTSRGFPTHDRATEYANVLWRASRLWSVKERIGLFTEAEIHSPQPVSLVYPPDWAAGKDAGWIPDHELGITIDGLVPSTFSTIIPEHKRILSQGEIRLPNRRVVSAEGLRQQIEHAGQETGNPKPSPQLDLALNTFSLACAKNSPMASVIHISTALEILAYFCGVPEKYGYEQAIRLLLEKYGLNKTLSADAQAGRNKQPKLLSTSLYALRGNLVHRGDSRGANLWHILDESMTACACILESLLTSRRSPPA